MARDERTGRSRVPARTSTAKSLPLRFAAEYGYSAMQLSRFLGCEGEVAEIGSLLRGAFSPEDE
jgi:hypothetical protein